VAPSGGGRVGPAVTDPLSELLRRRQVVVLDGAMATELEARGADLSGGLWSARLLVDRPELIEQVHRAYFEAGADVATTASYQASVTGFEAYGCRPDEAAELIVSSVRLARSARDAFAGGRGIVATSVGPYGAVLADGSEYRGDYDIGEVALVRFHAPRLAILAEPGVELFACETIPSLVEARALITALRDLPDARAWVSFSARDTAHISDGTPVAECARWLDAHDQVVAVGVNCTDVRNIAPLLGQLRTGTDKPLVVYPNSGETFDPGTHTWTGERANADFGHLAPAWYELGARIIGGCCRTSPKDIRRIAAAVRPG
jgi:homocysteine S-methyltransferase